MTRLTDEEEREYATRNDRKLQTQLAKVRQLGATQATREMQRFITLEAILPKRPSAPSWAEAVGTHRRGVQRSPQDDAFHAKYGDWLNGMQERIDAAYLAAANSPEGLALIGMIKEIGRRDAART